MNLKGSIEYVKLKGSVATQAILSGSYTAYVALKGSVAYFTRSLTTRAFIISRVIITASARILKKTSANISSKVTIIATPMVNRYLTPLIQSRAVIEAKALVYKSISVTIGTDGIIGTSAMLENIKNKTLEELKNLTLQNLTFAMGVLARIIRRTTALMKPQVTITASAIVVRKNTLEDIKDLYLEDIKNLTLQQLSETIV